MCIKVLITQNVFIAVTGPGKLTVGKLYGGILIYEIWKTTRFSNLEILAKMEQEMASKLEKDGVVMSDTKKEDTGIIIKGQDDPESAPVPCGAVEEAEERREEYDQYDDRSDFNDKKREYYNQR